MTWIFTYTGAVFDFEDAIAGKPCDIRIEDVARSLSELPRFIGHIRARVSIAEHSCVVSTRCGEIAKKRGWSPDRVQSARRKGFAHDFCEAYMGDIVRPIMVLARRFDITLLDDLERSISKRIEEAFLLDRIDDPEVDALVRRADDEALAYEKANFVPHHERSDQWPPLPPPPRSMKIVGLDSRAAYALFMSYAERLGFA